MTAHTTPYGSDRPRRKDPQILLAAARMLGAQMGPEFDSTDAHADLARALEEDCVSAMLRSLEANCWHVDDAILEVLQEGALHTAQTAYREAVCAWVQARGIHPQRSVGDQVRVAYLRGHIEGTVIDVNRAEATYTVSSPQLGHLPVCQLGPTGIIVTYESILSLVPPPMEVPLAGPQHSATDQGCLP